MNNSTAVSNVIPFRNSKLLLVESNGQPFIPMKPVVEGMGLDWKSQYAKLTAGRFNSTMVMITTVAEDGKKREMSCIPLRKLPGWLMSIHASKVREALREGVIAYQNECDDVLWEHWNRQNAPAKPNPAQDMTLLGSVIGTSGEMVLDRVLEQKGYQIPSTLQRSFRQTMKSRLRARFNVQKTALIPAEHLADACNFIVAYSVEGEWIPSDYAETTEVKVPQPENPDERWLVSFDHHGKQRVTPVPSGAFVLTRAEFFNGVLVDRDIMVSTEELFEFSAKITECLRRRSLFKNSGLESRN